MNAAEPACRPHCVTVAPCCCRCASGAAARWLRRCGACVTVLARGSVRERGQGRVQLAGALDARSPEFHLKAMAH